MNIIDAVAQLNRCLPLKAMQANLSESYRQLHQDMLWTLVRQGRPLSRAEIAAQIGDGAVDNFLQQLAADDLLVLDATGHDVAGAYPLTTAKTTHAIKVKGRHIYAMCALDAVSIAPMFETEVEIHSHCQLTQTPIVIHMCENSIKRAQPSSQVHVGIRWQQPCGHAAHSLCMDMVFLQDAGAAQQWQGSDAKNISLFTLPEAIQFGTAFFKPLLS